ncbi:phospholipase A1-Ibeta2, chloroplastic-like [Chenopodium quinoa]|uniref:Fungal lipase-type domain-containing protein n=1 Tax=Chenopodium quinoa TaxID=63459 RepID=A0A803L5K4_CHEQI|nr:phospholipase A1-Ibeta2, chloroplastic-like [Chenopodium quinoa]
MAQIAQFGSMLPSHNLKRAGFRCAQQSTMSRPSRLWASARAAHVQEKGGNQKTKDHLSNLDKLLQKEAAPLPPRPMKSIDREQQSESNRNRGLLQELNLARIWPEGIPGRAVEAAAEMSPRRLTRIQQMLLNQQPEYSPRNHLGARWREYHGSRDWVGLLDPLDENLRREMVRYGEFIQAAYQSFHSDPATTEEGIKSWREVGLPDKSYHVTKSLYATSSIGLPKWVDDVAPDLSWMTQRSSCVGYVAVCQDEREIARMGRRDIVISLRGTATCLEWAENFRALLVPMEKSNDQATEDQPKVECGFLSLFRTQGEHTPSLAESVVQEIKRLLETYKGETLSITITGHSLGAALAVLVADEISTCAPEVPPVAVFSFGGPRVGNRAFAERIKANNVKVLRIVNNQDVITRVPGVFLSEELEQKLMNNAQVAGVLEFLSNKMPLAYSHVGTELRVDTRMSPYLRPDADVACCHDLEAYLHLVDGFMASNCPFRPNAKRSLFKLLSEQGSNVKKLYTSKAKSLTLKIENDGVVSMSKCLPSPSSS